MRIMVTKPERGVFRVTVDDLRGATKRKHQLEDVTKETLAARLAPILDDWTERRRRIKEARKGPSG